MLKILSSCIELVIVLSAFLGAILKPLWSQMLGDRLNKKDKKSSKKN